MLLMQQANKLAKSQTAKTNKKAMRKAFAISNTRMAFFNPITTTELDYSVDNRTDPVPQTLDEILESLGDKKPRIHVSKSEISEDNIGLASFMKKKLAQSEINRARSSEDNKTSKAEYKWASRDLRLLNDWLTGVS